MFQWDKSINAINVAADKVVHLFRSMREVQLALPGVPAQQASAFLCQYHMEDGISTVAVFHLHKSQVLAFYFSEPRFVPEQKTDSMLDQGLNFVESMGFLMTDQDIHLLDEADQEMLWAALPLKAGLLEAESPSPEEAPAKKMQEKKAAIVEPPEVEIIEAEGEDKKTPAKPVKVVDSKPNFEDFPPAETEDAVVKKTEADPEPVENVDDLLAAVEAMRAKRPGLRARKLPPSAEEIDRRRLQLRETIGRILASL